MTQPFTFPKGAIQSADQLWFGRRVWRVCATGGDRWFLEATIARGPVPGPSFSPHANPDSFWIELRFVAGNRDSFFDFESLRDNNIGAHWNNNFLFSSEEDAREFWESQP